MVNTDFENKELSAKDLQADLIETPFNYNQDEYLQQNNKSYLYLQTANNGELRFIIATAIKEKLYEYCNINDTMAVKGYTQANKNHSISLCATKITFISDKHYLSK